MPAGAPLSLHQFLMTLPFSSRNPAAFRARLSTIGPERSDALGERERRCSTGGSTRDRELGLAAGSALAAAPSSKAGGTAAAAP